MGERVAVVTGGNRGIGLEVVRQLAGRGPVVLAARREQEGRRAADGLGPRAASARAAVLDVAAPASVERFAAALRSGEAEVGALVNNAGVYVREGGLEVARHTFAVNVLGPLRVTDALRPLLARGANVVMVSSGMGELSGLPAEARRLVEGAADRAGVERAAERLAELAGRAGGLGGTFAYSASKALLNAVVRLLAPELEERGVKVNAVCPGWVRTEMGGSSAPRSVEQGAAGVVWAATLPEGGPTGGIFRDGRPIGW